MKVALVNTSDLGGGAERSVVSLHIGLLKAGHQSTLYVGRKQTDDPHVVEIPYVRGPRGSRRIARMVERHTGWQDIYNPSFRALVNLIPPDTDVVHFNNLWGGSGGGYADITALPSITKRFPGVVTEHQTWFFTGHCAYFRDCQKWKKGCGRCPDLTIPPAIPRDGTAHNWRRKKTIVERSDVTFVGISKWVTGLAEQSPIWDGKRKLTIYEGIDTDVFVPVDLATKAVLREELGIPSDRTAVLVTGQTLAGFSNGFAPFGLEVAAKLSAEKVVLVLVGRAAQATAERLAFPSVAIPFQATPAAMAKCYQACDINLSASRVEAFGCIPAEAQACGIPVVATDCGGLADVVENGVGGLSVGYGDAGSLYRSLVALVSDSGLRHELGVNGRRFVIEKFSIAKVINDYLVLYASLAR